MRRLAKILVTATFATAMAGFAFAGPANAATPAAGPAPATHTSVTETAAETAAQTQAAGWVFYRTYQTYPNCAGTGNALVNTWTNLAAWICQERSVQGGWVYDLYLYQLN